LIDDDDSLYSNVTSVNAEADQQMSFLIAKVCLQESEIINHQHLMLHNSTYDLTRDVHCY